LTPLTLKVAILARRCPTRRSEKRRSRPICRACARPARRAPASGR